MDDIVAPFAGAWIEILASCLAPTVIMSLPSRERGLKFWRIVQIDHLESSLPSRERGLKLSYFKKRGKLCMVAPFAGAWIEIALFQSPRMSLSSLPSRERGLKLILS